MIIAPCTLDTVAVVCYSSRAAARLLLVARPAPFLEMSLLATRLPESQRSTAQVRPGPIRGAQFRLVSHPRDLSSSAMALRFPRVRSNSDLAAVRVHSSSTRALRFRPMWWTLEEHSEAAVGWPSEGTVSWA